MFTNLGLDVEFTILLVSILVVIAMVAMMIYFQSPQWFKALISKNNGSKTNDELDINSLFQTIYKAGYSYDGYQDLFYSNMDAWQRERGYCRLYDEAAAPFGMIIDCEPIKFQYEGKKWLIEFWKGQYDLTTGGEIGVYTSEKNDLNVAGVFKGTFYDCASDEDQLEMSFTLKKNGEVLFEREDRHWWLTGFKLGEYAEPSELTMDLNITLKDKAMRNIFIEALIKAGYLEEDLMIYRNTVCLEFNKPKTPQPITRTEETDWIIQKKNKLMCDKYQEITAPYDYFIDKMNAVYKQAPELFEVILKIGKNKDVFEKFNDIKDYLE